MCYTLHVTTIPAANHNNNKARGWAYKGMLLFPFLFIPITTSTTFYVDELLITASSQPQQRRDKSVPTYARVSFLYPCHHNYMSMCVVNQLLATNNNETRGRVYKGTLAFSFLIILPILQHRMTA